MLGLLVIVEQRVTAPLIPLSMFRLKTLTAECVMTPRRVWPIVPPESVMKMETRMAEPEPVTELSTFSSEDAIPTEWGEGRSKLREAEVYWLSTVRPDGRPHVTPLLGIWLDGALYFCTGPDERKAKNLARNPRCTLTSGCNRLDGLDLVVEGQAAKVSDPAELRSVADTFESKYGAHFTAPEGTWFGLGDTIRRNEALVFRVAPSTAFGFGKGAPYSQTRWSFPNGGTA